MRVPRRFMFNHICSKVIPRIINLVFNFISNVFEIHFKASFGLQETYLKQETHKMRLYIFTYIRKKERSSLDRKNAIAMEMVQT